MPETTPNQVEENNATQGETAEQERVFTQAEMDAIISDRLKRERAKYADYDEFKAKAAKFDEAEEAGKSELQKAVEERDRLKAENESLKAERERAEAITKAAAEYKVDATLLARMSGDVDENARFLAEQVANAPKYGEVHDGGEHANAKPHRFEIPAVI